MISLTIDSKAWQTWYGQAEIKWNGNPMTAQSGTVYCRGSMMFVCCVTYGSTIGINLDGLWFWGTMNAAGIQEGPDGYNYADWIDGLEEGEEPQ